MLNVVTSIVKQVERGDMCVSVYSRKRNEGEGLQPFTWEKRKKMMVLQKCEGRRCLWRRLPDWQGSTVVVCCCCCHSHLSEIEKIDGSVASHSICVTVKCVYLRDPFSILALKHKRGGHHHDYHSLDWLKSLACAHTIK